MPTAEMRNPPPQQHAATNPAFRGPSRSTQGPKSAADDPSITKNSVYIHASVLIFQSSAADCVMPIARLKGSQKTLKPYAIPIDKWMASAAGGTSHRLKSDWAMMRSRDRRPGMAFASATLAQSLGRKGRKGGKGRFEKFGELLEPFEPFTVFES